MCDKEKELELENRENEYAESRETGRRMRQWGAMLRKRG